MGQRFELGASKLWRGLRSDSRWPQSTSGAVPYAMGSFVRSRGRGVEQLDGAEVGCSCCKPRERQFEGVDVVCGEAARHVWDWRRFPTISRMWSLLAKWG